MLNVAFLWSFCSRIHGFSCCLYNLRFFFFLIQEKKWFVVVVQKIARCLALLPRIKGDEDSWSIMMQKIIIEIDMLLSNALEGLEGGIPSYCLWSMTLFLFCVTYHLFVAETKGSTVVRLLIPPGKDPPSRLGVQSRLREASELPTKMFHELIFPTISTLMHCCCLMLTNPFPTQVCCLFIVFSLELLEHCKLFVR